MQHEYGEELLSVGRIDIDIGMSEPILGIEADLLVRVMDVEFQDDYVDWDYIQIYPDPGYGKEPPEDSLILEANYGEVAEGIKLKIAHKLRDKVDAGDIPGY